MVYELYLVFKIHYLDSDRFKFPINFNLYLSYTTWVLIPSSGILFRVSTARRKQFSAMASNTKNYPTSCMCTYFWRAIINTESYWYFPITRDKAPQPVQES